MISFSQQIFSWISAGLNVKVLKHQLPMNTMDVAGKGVGMDFGVFVRTKAGSNLAFMVQDLNSRYHWKTNKIFEKGKEYIEQFPTLYRIGTTFNYNNFYVTADGGMIMSGNENIGYTLRIGFENPAGLAHVFTYAFSF